MARSICDLAYEDILTWRSNRDSIRGYFLPRSRIPYSIELIAQILRCPCARCTLHRNLLTPRHKGEPQERVDATEYSERIRDEYRSLFALLIWIKKSAFIVAFIQKRLNDEAVLVRLGEKKCEWHRFEAFEVVRCNVNAGFVPGSSNILFELTEHIEDHWSNFLRPRITDPTHESFNRRLTLPFFGQEPVGQGTGGAVYAFRIYDGYNGVSSAQHVKVFARKEIPLPSFGGEQKMLSRVNNLKHPHIARLLFSYQQADEAGVTKFNIVFRLSNTNLYSYLRDPRFGAQNLNFSDISKALVWTQVAGIVHALDKMHTMPGEFALHLDLKPANILVEIESRTNEPTFLITDFGLAKLRNPLNHGSGVQQGGGDEAYAPPEEDGDRKHDIWSMGCIVLEVLSFVLGGFAAVQRLDKARGTDNPYRPFWEKNASGQPQISTSVKNHMDWLVANAEDQKLSPRQLRFVGRILKLIELMFCVGKSKRPRAGEIFELLQQALADENWRFTSGSISSPDTVSNPEPVSRPSSGSDIVLLASREPSMEDFTEDTAPELPAPRRNDLPDVQFVEVSDGWIEIGDPATRMLRGLLARWNRYPTYEPAPIRLQVLERSFSKTSELRLVIFQDYVRGSREFTAERWKLKLIPAYALRKDHSYTRTLAGLRFVAHDDDRSFFDIDLDGDPYDLRVVQGILMGQNILCSIDVKGIQIQQPKPAKYKKLLPSQTQSTSLLLDQRGITTIQLWKETGRNRFDCKIVVYATPPHNGPSQIFVIGFSESYGFESKIIEGKNHDSLSSYLNNNAPPVYLSILKPPDGRKEPSFSIDQQQFEIQCRENKNLHRFESIDIQFQNEKDRTMFLSWYRALKKQWMTDMKSLLKA